MRTFLSHRPFHVLMCNFSLGGPKSVADIDRGGQNLYISENSQYYHYFSSPEGEGQTPLPTSMGALAGFATPWMHIPESHRFQYFINIHTLIVAAIGPLYAWHQVLT